MRVPQYRGRPMEADAGNIGESALTRASRFTVEIFCSSTVGEWSQTPKRASGKRPSRPERILFRGGQFPTSRLELSRFAADASRG
jgi:hypothetical protein